MSLPPNVVFEYTSQTGCTEAVTLNLNAGGTAYTLAGGSGNIYTNYTLNRAPGGQWIFIGFIQQDTNGPCELNDVYMTPASQISPLGVYDEVGGTGSGEAQ